MIVKFDEIHLFSLLLMEFRFPLDSLPCHATTRQVNGLRKQMGLTAQKIFEDFRTFCKSILNIFPRAHVIYLGTSRTWFYGPHCRPARGLTYPTFKNGRKFVPKFFWARTKFSTENQKRERLRHGVQVNALPVYRRLRRRFFSLFKKVGISAYTQLGKGHSFKNISFNDVFGNLRESHVFDQFGHLSRSGTRLVAERLRCLFSDLSNESACS